MAESVDPGSFGPFGPGGGEEKLSPTWLILQRLEDLNRRIDGLGQDLARRMDDLEKRVNQRMDDRFNAVDKRIGDFRSVNWIILVAVLGILAKMLFPAL